jgi:hypothetical protein
MGLELGRRCVDDFPPTTSTDPPFDRQPREGPMPLSLAGRVASLSAKNEGSAQCSLAVCSPAAGATLTDTALHPREAYGSS